MVSDIYTYGQWLQEYTHAQWSQWPDDLSLQNHLHAAYSDIYEKVEAVTDIDDFSSTIEYKLLGREFLQAVKRGNPATVAAYLDAGMSVNYQDPRTKQTALHVAAACRARAAIRVLVKHPDCNFIIRDRYGRLPSELAYEFGADPVLARYLTIKEFKQAKVEKKILKYRTTLSNITLSNIVRK